MSRPRALFVALVALGLAAALAGRVLPAALATPWRWALLVLLPLTVGALGSLLVQPPERRRLRAEVPVPGLRHLPMVGALVLLDLGAVLIGHALGWIQAPGGLPAFSPLRFAALAVGMPIVLFVGVHGWEWGLRARLYAPWARAGGAELAVIASLVAGAALALPALAPGLRVDDRGYLASVLAAALAREAIALRLFRRAGVLLSGSYRGLLLGLDALLVADGRSLWTPLVPYVVGDPRFEPLRGLVPWLGLLVAALWCARLDRQDAEARHHP